jgi:hypothetical protein
VQNLQIQGDLNRLLQTIEDGTAYSGTDGSYKDGYGTAAFRIQNDLGDQITGCNITPGLQEQQSAYRSELGGIVGILVLLDLLQQHYDLRIDQFVITCDCSGAGLKSLTDHRQQTMTITIYSPRHTRSRPKQQLTQCINGWRGTKQTDTAINSWTNTAS